MIEDTLREDIENLKNKGLKIILVGDFNGRIKSVGTDEGGWKADNNGWRVIWVANNNDLDIMKHSKQCKGKWTWVHRGTKSVIDMY